jgi:hypothetical protein
MSRKMFEELSVVPEVFEWERVRACNVENHLRTEDLIWQSEKRWLSFGQFQAP